MFILGGFLTGCQPQPQQIKISNVEKIGVTPTLVSFEQPITARNSQVLVCAKLVGRGYRPGRSVEYFDGPDGKKYVLSGKITSVGGSQRLLTALAFLPRRDGDMLCVMAPGGVRLSGEAFVGAELSSSPDLAVDGLYFYSYEPK